MFDYLKKLEIGDKTAECPMPELSADAVLIGRPATSANEAYFTAMQKLSGRRVQLRAAGGGQISPEVLQRFLDENREEDRKLYPIHVITGWRGVFEEDANGNRTPVSFSVDACAELFEKLPDDLVDRPRTWFSNPHSFRYDDDEAPPDPRVLAGNSDRGSSGSSS